MSAADCATLEAAAATFWDKFYNVNQDRFFKDRHYLHREFPLLLAPNITVLEVCMHFTTQKQCESRSDWQRPALSSLRQSNDKQLASHI